MLCLLTEASQAKNAGIFMCIHSMLREDVVYTLSADINKSVCGPYSSSYTYKLICAITECRGNCCTFKFGRCFFLCDLVQEYNNF